MLLSLTLNFAFGPLAVNLLSLSSRKHRMYGKRWLGRSYNSPPPPGKSLLFSYFNFFLHDKGF